MTEARTLTEALGGRWHGRYGIAFCPAHDNRRTPALSLSDGDNGRLLAKCFAGCRFQEIVEALRGLGKLDNDYPRQDFAPIQRNAAEDNAQSERRLRMARQIWDEGEPIAWTLAGKYLRGRAIGGALPDSLRFHGACWHGPTAKRYPAMVAKVERAGRLVGIQRTYLGKTATKAKLEGGNKLSLGACSGGAVRLSDGAGPLVVCEGVETGLSLRDGLSGRCGAVWACLGTSGLRNVELPGNLSELVIAPDGDVPGIEAAKILAQRAASLGYRVRLMEPPKGADWNDVARGVAA